jgi:hypothetical protein
MRQETDRETGNHWMGTTIIEMSILVEECPKELLIKRGTSLVIDSGENFTLEYFKGLEMTCNSPRYCNHTPLAESLCLHFKILRQ